MAVANGMAWSLYTPDVYMVATFDFFKINISLTCRK